VNLNVLNGKTAELAARINLRFHLTVNEPVPLNVPKWHSVELCDCCLDLSRSASRLWAASGAQATANGGVCSRLRSCADPGHENR